MKYLINKNALIISGSNKGKTGSILKVTKDKIFISGINERMVSKKGQKDRNLKNLGIHISNIMIKEKTKTINLSKYKNYLKTLKNKSIKSNKKNV